MEEKRIRFVTKEEFDQEVEGGECFVLGSRTMRDQFYIPHGFGRKEELLEKAQRMLDTKPDCEIILIKDYPIEGALDMWRREKI